MAELLLDTSPFFTFSQPNYGKYHIYTYAENSGEEKESDAITAKWYGKVKETTNKTVQKVTQLLV